MAQLVSIEVPFNQLLEVVDRLDAKERDSLHDRLLQRDEDSFVRQVKRAANDFGLNDSSVGLNFQSAEKALDELHRKLEAYEQEFGIDSKSFYVASSRGQGAISAEGLEWIRLYETYQRLRTARRRVNSRAGRPIESLPVGKVTSRQMSLARVEEKLRQFEQQYGMSSAEFYENFKRGKQGDDAETFEWVHTYVAYLTMSGSERPEEAEDV